MNDTILASITKSKLGEMLDGKDLEMMITYNKVCNYKKGDAILPQGKESPGIYLVVSGKIRETARILVERTAELEVLEPGDTFGECSFIEKIPSGTSMIAETDTICVLLSKTYLDWLAEDYPEVRYKLFKSISMQVCKRLTKLHNSIIDFMASADMSTKSYFQQIIHSFTSKPVETTLAEQHIDEKLMLAQSFFARFTAEEQQELLKHASLIRCAKHSTLIQESTTPICYIVIQGAVVSGIMHDQKSAKLSVIGPITLFANVGCLDKKPPFMVSFTTCEEAILYKITSDNLQYFQKKQPQLWYKLYYLICRSVIVLEKSFNKLEVRLNIEKYNR